MEPIKSNRIVFMFVFLFIVVLFQTMHDSLIKSGPPPGFFVIIFCTADSGGRVGGGGWGEALYNATVWFVSASEYEYDQHD